MEEQLSNSIEAISQEGERTPASVKRLVEKLPNERGSLRNNSEIASWASLQEQVNRTSANSSQPPSQDPPKGFKPSRSSKSGKKRGGKGHKDMNVGFIRWNSAKARAIIIQKHVGSVVESSRKTLPIVIKL